MLGPCQGLRSRFPWLGHCQNTRNKKHSIPRCAMPRPSELPNHLRERKSEKASGGSRGLQTSPLGFPWPLVKNGSPPLPPPYSGPYNYGHQKPSTEAKVQAGARVGSWPRGGGGYTTKQKCSKVIATKRGQDKGIHYHRVFEQKNLRRTSRGKYQCGQLVLQTRVPLRVLIIRARYYIGGVKRGPNLENDPDRILRSTGKTLSPLPTASLPSLCEGRAKPQGPRAGTQLA